MSAPIRSITPSLSSVARTAGFSRTRRRLTSDSLGEVHDLRHLRRALGVDEVDPLAVEHDAGELRRRLDHLAQAVLQGVRGGEEEAAVEPDHGDAGKHFVAGVPVGFTEDLGTRLASEGGHLRVGGHRDEPDEREPDPDHDAREHAEDEGADDRRDRDPEVESLHPGQPPHFAARSSCPSRRLR